MGDLGINFVVSVLTVIACLSVIIGVVSQLNTVTSTSHRCTKYNNTN